MKRFTLVFLSLLLVFPLTGCWDAKSIDKRLLPAIMGVELDKDKKTYIVSLRIPDPQSKDFHTVHAKSKTISDALDKIRMNEERSIDVLHLTLIIVSEELAKKGIEELIQYVIRSREIKSKALLAVAKGDIYKLLQSRKNLRKEKGIEMLDLFSPNAGWTPNVSLNYIWEAFRDIQASTVDMAVPILREGSETLFIVEGSAIFHNDKQVGTISTDETFLYNLFRDRFTSGIVEITSSSSLEIVDAKISHRTSWVSDRPKIFSTLHLKAIVVEADEKTELNTNTLKLELEKLLEERFQKLFGIARSKKADIFMTGVIFRSKLAPDQVDLWEDQLYEKLIMDFKTEVIIRNTGNIRLGQ